VFCRLLDRSHFVHSLHFSWSLVPYTVPILYNLDTEEIPPLVQPAMPHFQVLAICCASCCSRSVLRSLKPGRVVKSATPVEDLMDHVRLVPPLTQRPLNQFSQPLLVDVYSELAPPICTLLFSHVAASCWRRRRRSRRRSRRPSGWWRSSAGSPGIYIS